MKLGKYVILSTSLAFSLMLAGCSNNKNTELEEAVVSETSTQYLSETINGQVSELNGSEITVTLGTISNFEDSMGSGETPPGDAPSGDAPSGDATSEDAPSGDKPSGEIPAGGGSMPGSIFTAGEESYTFTIAEESVIYLEQETSEDAEEQGTLADIQDGSILSIEFDAEGNISKVVVLNAVSQADMAQSGTPGQTGSQSSGVDSYEAVTTYTEDATVDGGTFTSVGTDENAILVQEGASVVLKDIILERTSEDSTGGDNSSFYGVGAGLLVTDGTAYIKAGTFTTDAAGGAGVFAYGDGIAYLADSVINTLQGTSGGIHVAGGGTLYAWNLTAETDGESSAAIRSDRGSGTMVIDGGSYTSNGVGSPVVYSTADITINEAELTATGSEAVCIEGFNSLRLYNSNLTGNMPVNEQNDCIWNIILYQSMSGDSEVGNSNFEMTGGSITSENGGLFYTTNTECTITLKDVEITTSDSNDFLLMCTGNTNTRGWGSSGSNGSDCVFTADSQEMVGDVIWDSISNLDFYLMAGSTLTGAFVNDETYAGNGGDGYASLYIDSDSKWVVTGDSTVSNLYSEGTIVDESGKTVSIVGTDGTVYLQGAGDITVTVGQYSDTVDLSGANAVTDYADYAVEKPEQLQ
ncbi:MAG: hypothetical protein WBI07_17585 [Mobilitalea sp.]